MNRSLLVTATSALVAFSMTLPAFAEGTSSSKAMKRQNPTVDTACMAAAVSARDTAISTALTPVVTAIQMRGQALAAAWGMTDAAARKTAIKAANTAFTGTWKKFNTARKTAWTTYRTAAKACKGVTADAVESQSEVNGSM